MGGREGLIDTAMKTFETGYIQRLLVKSMEDIMVKYNGTVRNSLGDVIQFLYEEDGMDSVWIETHKLDSLKAKKSTFDALVFDAEVQKLEADKHQLGIDIVIAGENSWPLSVNIQRVPGEMIGCIAAQSTGQSVIQMTLNTFYYAGVSAKNIMLSVPRLREIINVVKKIKTPYISVYLKPEKLSMADIAEKINLEFNDDLTCIFNDDNAEKLILRIRIMNDEAPKGELDESTEN
ncbi:hypothetical protein T459_23547 [Capsicum annuum]|uniref:DNA-directed RNA polymerase n=1 Tax=Capsicum annuum TaxID=4072 RepID=A0A2G2YSN7_CAPAN|nr:hypothetical protein FXO37_08645 [Capsicum annuum]PHT72762.1 hypothetical protein T459_23547 [Capsicum annuum]